MTRDDYLAQLNALLPPGSALLRDGDGVLAMLLGMPAGELARVEARAIDVLNEADPRTTNELLAEWEAAYGLPDDCTREADILTVPSTEARRAALVARVIGAAGQSRAYFIGLAATLGYAGATVEEFRIARVGRARIGDAIHSYEWTQAWRLRLGATAVRPARVGSARAGESLVSFGDARIECAVRRAAPAQTLPLFAYGP